LWPPRAVSLYFFYYINRNTRQVLFVQKKYGGRVRLRARLRRRAQLRGSLRQQHRRRLARGVERPGARPEHRRAGHHLV